MHWQASSPWRTDLERTIGLEVSDDVDANTLSGLFMYHLSRMPRSGDTITDGGYRLTVESVEDYRVGEVLIEAIEPEPETTTTPQSS